ncbi:thiol peroxidase [Carnobacterium mobile]|uniref:thiol peroxidase n=1 Tax=Carnobacterium mobile TaxID=2750 RepID=UPI00186836C2|nr:thiol peroxidase [Carnobacterium mobile]
MEFTRKGTPLKVEGTQPAVGEQSPDFSLKNLEDETIELSQFKGKVVLISVVPDIDTRVCAIQTKAFNADANDIEGVQLITVSTNTKEQQEKWCAGEGIEMEMLHDTDQTFGKTYGIAIPELNALVRSVFVIDGSGKLVYKETVAEMVEEPDYDKAIEAAKAAR